MSKLEEPVLHNLIRLIVQSIISLVLLISGLYILMWNNNDPTTHKLASGWVGAVIGYWLR